MENNRISYDKLIFDFDKIFNKAKNIKQRIELEIKKINNSYIILMDEITASFEQQHNKLNEKEKNIKFELDLKVTKIKEELENFLKESNDILISCERIEKAIKYYEKKKINNEIKILYYISEINKNNEIAKNFIKKQIKNIEIYYNSDLNTLEYKDYYCSGIPIPKNIKIEKQESKLLIYWDIDNYIIKDFNKKNIQYKIEVKEDNKILVYKSSEKHITIDKYKYNIKYEVKIRAFFDCYFGDWSENIKFKIDKDLPKEKNNNNLMKANINHKSFFKK